MAEGNGFFSIWTQDSPYWLVVEGEYAPKLAGFASVYRHESLYAVKAPASWVMEWAKAQETLRQWAPDGYGHRVAVIAADILPSLQEIELSLRSVSEIQSIADNLWLMTDVQEERLSCYLQRVIDRRGKQVGFEAFARIEAAGGKVIDGGTVMRAANALRVEYQLDKLLHKQAIESFVSNDLEGYIFINFLTGFIQRPEVYLEGLSQAVMRCHVRPGAVVLDVPLGSYPGNQQKLASIAEYCRARGFALAIDDVTQADGLAAVLSTIRPAFIKLDRTFGSNLNELMRQVALRDTVRQAHAVGTSVIAEGIEDKASHDAYFAADVDMFQGYLFGAPERYPNEAPQAQAQ